MKIPQDPNAPVAASNWAGGVDNLAPADRVPEGFVRSAVNVDVTPGGGMHLRSGFERAYAGSDVRGVLALGHKLLMAAGTSLVEFDTRTLVSRVLRTIAGNGRLVGDVLNNTLYFTTANEALCYDGTTVRPWGVPDVVVQPLPTLATGGSLRAGRYKLAVTFTVDGLEGGTDVPLYFDAAADSGFDVALPAPPPGGTTNLYVSSADGLSLYWQGSFDTARTHRVSAVRDDTHLLATANMHAPHNGTVVRTHGSQLAVADGKTLWLTVPMRPHLIDRQRGFFQYPAAVNELLSAGDLFVSADKSYALRGTDSDTPEQRTALEFPALPGTAVTLPDGRGAWMTQYGQAVSGSGGLELVTRGHFVPDRATAGAAGVVDHNGNQLIVTTTRGPQGASPLAASDFFIGEVVR